MWTNFDSWDNYYVTGLLDWFGNLPKLGGRGDTKCNIVLCVLQCTTSHTIQPMRRAGGILKISNFLEAAALTAVNQQINVYFVDGWMMKALLWSLEWSFFLKWMAYWWIIRCVGRMKCNDSKLLMKCSGAQLGNFERGRRYIQNRKDEIIHGLSSSVKCIRDMSW